MPFAPGPGDQLDRTMRMPSIISARFYRQARSLARGGGVSRALALIPRRQTSTSTSGTHGIAGKSRGGDRLLPPCPGIAAGLCQSAEQSRPHSSAQGNSTKPRPTYSRPLPSIRIMRKPTNNLGNIFLEQGLLKEAVHCYKRTLMCRPDFTGAHSNLLVCRNYDPDAGPEAVNG